jgi:hypothetical protein
METVISKEVPIKQQLGDILLDITWSKIASRYFGKSSAWLYSKLDGIDDSGGEYAFTNSEKLQFRNALFDFSERVRHTAEKIAV